VAVVTRSIVGYKKEESDALLNFLYDHIAFGADFQARVQWKPRMVIFWDVGLESSLVMSVASLISFTDDMRRTVL
jgi:sulfonate dioxygenase